MAEVGPNQVTTLKGMTPDEILALLPDMYLDAEGFTRIRRQQIRAVPDLD